MMRIVLPVGAMNIHSQTIQLTRCGIGVFADRSGIHVPLAAVLRIACIRGVHIRGAAFLLNMPPMEANILPNVAVEILLGECTCRIPRSAPAAERSVPRRGIVVPLPRFFGISSSYSSSSSSYSSSYSSESSSSSSKSSLRATLVRAALGGLLRGVVFFFLVVVIFVVKSRPAWRAGELGCRGGFCNGARGSGSRFRQGRLAAVRAERRIRQAWVFRNSGQKDAAAAAGAAVRGGMEGLNERDGAEAAGASEVEVPALF